MVTKHVKPRKMGEPGGIVKAEGAIYACKVHGRLPHAAASPPVSAHKIYEDGTKERICKKCGETL